MPREIWLFRHGETEWSASGAHTGRTDLPLTDAGRERAAKLRDSIAGHAFALVLSSPMQRARETCVLAGLGENAQIDPDLCEWDYGDYEGRTTAEIRRERPHWNLWIDGVPNGETVEQVAERARRVIDRVNCVGSDQDAALFAHGHFLRILASCWIGLDPHAGSLFALSTGSISVLGLERDTRVIVRWNETVS